MKKIITNLKKGEVLYETKNRTKYKLPKVMTDGSITYSIGENEKTLPIETINAAFIDFKNHITLNREWYKNFNEIEATSRPCNLSVLKNLLRRL